MGTVAITLRILPEGPEVDIVRLTADVRGALGSRLKTLERRPFAYGLTALMVTVLVDDASGGSEPIEAELAALPGVSSAEATDLSLV